MKLIVDSGSTKTNWVGVEQNNIVFEKNTKGINPIIQQYDEIEKEIQQLATDIVVEGFYVTHIYYYGAGCNTQYAPVVKSLLEQFFGSEILIEVNSDLLAAARAICQYNDGIACILGTGSNSCLYINNKVVQNTPALGYILGDEGSGASIGRTFLNGILKGWISTNIKQQFFEKYDLSVEQIINKVYKEPFANRFLASLSPFIYMYKDQREINQMIKTQFREFIKLNVLPYKHNNLNIGFVGSVAYYYKSELQEVTQEFGLKISKIIKTPIKALVEYHQKS